MLKYKMKLLQKKKKKPIPKQAPQRSKNTIDLNVLLGAIKVLLGGRGGKF